MSRWRVLRALLDKELHHNRGYFLVTAVLLIYVPVLKSLYYLLQGGNAVREWGPKLTDMLSFHQKTMGPPPFSHDTMYFLAVGVAVLLGAILLGEERKGSLIYLCTTPVSRRDIVLAKFLSGSGTLLAAMGINTLFLITLSGLLGLDLSLMTLIRWGLIMSLGLVCLFTLSLCASTFASGTLPAAGLSFLLVYIPGILVALVETTAARYFHVPELFSIKAQYVGNYLTITDYLTGDHWFKVQHVDHYPNWIMTGVSGTSGPAPHLGLESGLLLLYIAVLLGVAIIVFEHLSLEEQGTFFASHRSRQVFIILGALLVGYLFIFPYCATLPVFLAGLGIIIIVMFGLFEWLPHKLRS